MHDKEASNVDGIISKHLAASCGKELGQKIIAFTHPQRPLFWIGRSDHFQQISCNFHPLSQNLKSFLKSTRCSGTINSSSFR